MNKKREEEDHGLHDRQIHPHDGFIGQGPHAMDGKNGFDDDGAAQQKPSWTAATLTTGMIALRRACLREPFRRPHSFGPCRAD